MNKLSNRLTQGITNKQPNIIQGFVRCFIEDFVPNQDYVIVEGYETPMIEYYAWDEEEDGPIPGIKLFKDLNIYLEREYCEY